MRWIVSTAAMLVGLAAFVQTAPMHPPSRAAASGDATLSPYFWVKSEDPTLDQLPLKATIAKVEIAGVIADVKVTQVYKNEGRRPLEAIYVFPGSTRSAVYSMKMTIGERVILAKIREKAQARQEYEQARAQGRSASLLEQQRPNVFQMNVANIMPGDEIRVELSYTELIVPTDGVYEFVYPTVVGPRYSNTPAAQAEAAEKWVANPTTKAGEAPLSSFDIQVKLAAGLPIHRALCETHKTVIVYNGANEAEVRLDAGERLGGNRDFILRYHLAGGQIQSGLLLAKGTEENFFLLQVQPPKAIRPVTIPPREFVFIMDVSGSQMGFPIEISKVLMKDLVSHLRPQDRFNVEVFESGSALWSPQGSKPATEDNIKSALAFVGQQSGGGGTEIISALRRALALPRIEGMSRTFVISTDGYISVEAGVLDVIRENLGDANMFAFGIGSSVNRFLIEGMAHAGMGEPFVITKAEEAPAQAERFRDYIAAPVLTQVRVSFNGIQAYDVEPLHVPDVLADRPVLCFGKWHGEAAGTMEVSGVSGEGAFHQSFKVSEAKVMESSASLRNLWARHRIQLLGDYAGLANAKAQQQTITELGLKYGLLTEYTSFVAIDNQIRNQGGRVESVTQPLPLPQGVADQAVGGGVPCAAPMSCLSAIQNKEEVCEKRGRISVGDSTERSASKPKQALETAPAPIPAEITIRLQEPALLKLLGLAPAGTKLELRIDGQGRILHAHFSKAFKGADKACELIRKWRLVEWKVPGITSLSVAI